MNRHAESLPHILRRHPGAERGFTLVELMVVLILIAIMTAVIIPEMRGTYEDSLLRSTARKLVDVLGLTYSRSVTRNELHRIRLDRKAGRYFVEAQGQAAPTAREFATLRDVSWSQGEWDTRIALEIRKPADDSAEPADPDPGWSDRSDSRNGGPADTVAFYPDGTADATEIRLRDREGFRLALRVHPTTARVRIVELDRE